MISFVECNVIIFFVLEFMGDPENAVFMMEHGAVYPPYIIERKEYKSITFF